MLPAYYSSHIPSKPIEKQHGLLPGIREQSELAVSLFVCTGKIPAFDICFSLVNTPATLLAFIFAVPDDFQQLQTVLGSENLQPDGRFKPSCLLDSLDG